MFVVSAKRTTKWEDEVRRARNAVHWDSAVQEGPSKMVASQQDLRGEDCKRAGTRWASGLTGTNLLKVSRREAGNWLGSRQFCSSSLNCSLLESPPRTTEDRENFWAQPQILASPEDQSWRPCTPVSTGQEGCRRREDSTKTRQELRKRMGRSWKAMPS